MKKRRALLIGVPEYENKKLDLPVVRNDVENLHSSLEKSGFIVRTLGMGDKSETGRNKIAQALRRECRDAKGIETLILYFSGHGVHYEGKDYLVPSDADLDDPDLEDYLVSTDILGDAIDDSDANTIIFIIDACRHGIELGIKGIGLTDWSRGKVRKATRRSFVLVFACSPAQVSQYVGGEAGFSLFSKALAEVLDPQYPACTLEEVLKATQEKLNALVAEHKKKPQEIRRCFESAVEDDTFSRIICEGQSPAVVPAKTLDPWSEAALNSPVWNEGEAEENSTLAQLKEQVAKILAACWQQWQAAIRALPKDPWRDEKLPIRLLEKLDMLVSGSEPPVTLTQAEIALVLTVPFVREAVLASGIVQAAQVNPLALEETRPKTGFRLALDKSHQGQPRFLRKAQRLQEQGCIAEKDAVMSWLMHRCLMRSLELWLPEAEGGYLSDNFIAALEDARRCKCRLAKETLVSGRLLELARCLFADLERIDRDDRPNALQSRLTVVGRSYREEQEIREKMLAYLLKMAGLLAIDGRTLSDVLVDHVGLADPLTPEQALDTITQADWKPSGRSRTLKVTCNHQAVDLALAEHVESANAVLTHIFRQVAEKREMEVLAGLPTHLMPDGIVPEQDGGVPAYQKPHVNFQLAHDEIRELLMGEQLYGDPGLAIRELYQNALDACRYREARLNYLKQTGQYQGLYQQWQGRIIFRQDKDQNGREYIECEDNGIGMGMLHLSQCFARAGRRFADLSEFIEERAQWLKCDPPIRLYPNSQFGVGVLSYFMLADEIEVETCRLDRQGRPDRKLRVRIPGSSGLFRVRDGGIGIEAGTRVRLYLNRTRHQGRLISCIEILRKLLWVAEFPTEVQQGARREVWEVGRLRHPDISENQCLAVGDNVWWVPQLEYLPDETGCILSDGLWTEETRVGIVVNLRQDYYPKLTVDRKNIVEWDRRHVRELLIQNSKPLLSWSSLTLKWLWGLSKKHPHVAAHIVQLLSQQQVNVQLGEWRVKNIEVSIAEVGCFAFDENLTSRQNIQQLIRLMPWWIMPYRVALWGKYGLLKLSAACLESIPASMQPEFCTIPEPRDAIVLSWKFEGNRIANSDDQDGQISPAQIVLAAAHLEEPIAVTLKRIQRFAPLGLEVSEVNSNSLGDLTATEEDLVALSRRLEGKEKIPWQSKRIPPAQVVLASARLNEPVAETLKRLQKFTPLGLEVPEVEPESLGDVSATPEDLVALSSELDGQYPYWHKRISLAQVILTAKRLNESIAKTLKRFQKFTPLGLEMPEIDSESLGNLTVTEEDLIALSRFLDGKSALDKDQVPPAHIVLAANKLKESITQTLQRFVLLGLQIPQVDWDSLKTLTITPDDLIALSEYLNGGWALSEKQVSPAHIIRAAVKLKEPISETIKRLKRFAPLGLEVPEIDVDLESLQQFIADEKNLIALSKYLNEESPLLEDNVHPAHVVIAACALNEPVPVTLERMRRFAPLFEITLPEGEPNSWQIGTPKRNESTDLEV
jgi:hypothetical protein